MWMFAGFASLSLPRVLHAVLGMDEGCSRGRQPMSECLNPPLG